LRQLIALALLFAPITAVAGAKDAAVKAAMEKIWEEGDLSVIDDAYEEELGNEIRRFVQENRDLYPDLKIEIVDSVIKGNRYVTVWEAIGTHKDLKRRVRLEGVSVRTREGGVFTEEKMFYDQKSIYDQLGFTVSPPEGLSPFKVAGSRADAPAEHKPAEAPAAEEAPAEAPAAEESAAEEAPAEAPAAEAPAAEAPAAEEKPAEE